MISFPTQSANQFAQVIAQRATSVAEHAASASRRTLNVARLPDGAIIDMTAKVDALQKDKPEQAEAIAQKPVSMAKVLGTVAGVAVAATAVTVVAMTFGAAAAFIVPAALAIALGLYLVGGPDAVKAAFEKAGRAVQSGAEAVGNAVKSGAEAVGNAAKKVGSFVKGLF